MKPSAEPLKPFPSDWERALAVVAHPDDMEFGAAGAVAAWTAAGKTVDYLLVTRGEAGIDGLDPETASKVREEEQRTSAGIVGVSTVEFFDHHDGVIEYSVALRRELAAAIRRSRPDLVVGFNHHDITVSGKWNSPDHRAVGRALLDAVGDAGNRWVFPELGLEPWAVSHLAVAASPYPTHGVDIGDNLDAAVASLEAHSAYLGGLGITDVRTPLVGYAEVVGQRLGGRPAIAFELVVR